MKAYPKVDADKLKSEFNQLCISLLDYLKTIKIDQIDRTKPAYRIITELVKKNYSVIDFNYTDTVNFITEQLGKGKDNPNLFKMHGSLGSGKIIFGVEDSAQLEKGFNFLKKSSDLYFKGGSNIKEILSNATSIIFFGYSLGETDYMYFSDFFEDLILKRLNPKSICFFYHDKKGYDDLLEQLNALTHSNNSKLRSNHRIYFEPA